MTTTPQPQRLIQIAQHALQRFLLKGEKWAPPLDRLHPEDRGQEAVFITLRTEEGELRGCVGNIAPELPLGVAVALTTVLAASEDPRFLPVQAGELPHLILSISRLSPFHRVSGASEIVPRRHGVLVRRENRQGLFLPQVWNETGWDRDRFLAELCSAKAGLEPEAWKDPATELFVFEVQELQAPAGSPPQPGSETGELEPGRGGGSSGATSRS